MEKLVISISMGDKPPESKPKIVKQVSLSDKIEHAICCIECRTPDRYQAIEFLRKVFMYLDRMDHKKEADLALLERVKPVIHEYGYSPDEDTSNG